MTAPAPSSHRGRWAVVAVGSIAVVAVALVGGLLLQAPPEPAPPSTVVAPPRAPLIVEVSHAGDPTAYVGFPTSVSVHALGNEPIRSVELWVGDRLVAEASSAGGAPAQVARWSWTPSDPGPKVLVARVTDAAGREVQSQPLRLVIEAEAPRFRPVRQVAVEVGETAVSAATRAGGEATDLTRWNTGLDPMAPLEAGTVVFVPLPIAEVPRPDPGPEVELLAGLLPGPVVDLTAGAGVASLVSWSGAGPDVTFGPSEAGTGPFVAPEVTPSVDGCTIKLAVSSAATAATGLAIYGAAPSSTAFTRVATFPTGGSAPVRWQTAASAGSYLFSVSTFDDAVEEQGDLIEVEVPEGCADPGWTGDATLAGGRLQVDQQVDRAYLYVSLDGGPYQRVPVDPGMFVEPLDGELDFGPHLPADLASRDVDLEAWGWLGGGLVPLGRGHQDPAPATPEPGSPPPDPIGGGAATSTALIEPFTELDWIAQPAAPSSEIQVEEVLLREGELIVWAKDGAVLPDLTEDFRWLTNADGADSVIWQVAAFPIPTDVAPDAPGVLLQKVVAIDEGTKSGEFPIDFRPIFAPDKSASIGDVSSGGLVQQLTQAQLGASTSAPSSPTPTASGSAGPATAGGSTVYSPSWLLPVFTPSVLYVRAIPMDGTAVVGGVSNFVKLTVVSDDPWVYDPTVTPSGPAQPKPTPGLKPYQLFLEFIPPANANPAFRDCVMVTGFQEGIQPGAWGLQPGDFICRFEPGGGASWSLADAFQDFVGFVADAWDAVTSAWSWLQSQLATFLATYSGCSAIGGGDFCKQLAQVAIAAALASVGIPPSLPNTEELIALGKAELKETLVELASKAATDALGFDPCAAAEIAKLPAGTPTCDEVVEDFIEDFEDQLAALKSSEATALTGVVVPYGIDVVPHPWGTLRPPHFRVTIARNVAVPLPTTGTCRMTLSMGSFVDDWTHPVYDPQSKSWGSTTQDVAGAPFVALTMDVPDPTAPGSGAVKLSPNLPPDASIYQIMQAALAQKQVIKREYYLTEATFWREPGNPDKVYESGKGWTYFVDQGRSRAWVLLQNGTAVKAQVAVPPYAADCFDAVAATGAIPSIDQGYPCTPFQDPSSLWEASFSGLGSDPLKCQIMYALATGY